MEKLLSLETFGAGELRASQGQWVPHLARSGRNRHGAAVPNTRDFNLFFHFFLLFSFMPFSPSPPSALLHNPCVSLRMTGWCFPLVKYHHQNWKP